MKKHARGNGISRTPEYTAWLNMKSRCRNPNTPAYKNYGARGIDFCERWESFENFLEDMGRKPSPNHTLERKDNSKGYEPSNCIWTTYIRNLRNRRNTIYVEYNGQVMPAADACEIAGISLNLFNQRLSKGLSGDELFKPKKC